MRKLLLLLFTGLSTACVSVPDVYLIDRHTVMELEAAGEWPELEQRFRTNSIKSGAIDIQDPFSEQRKEKVFTMLQGEFVSDQKGEQ